MLKGYQREELAPPLARPLLFVYKVTVPPYKRSICTVHLHTSAQPSRASMRLRRLSHEITCTPLPVRHAVYPWVATAIQGQFRGKQPVSKGKRSLTEALYSGSAVILALIWRG